MVIQSCSTKPENEERDFGRRRSLHAHSKRQPMETVGLAVDFDTWWCVVECRSLVVALRNAD